MGYQNQSWCWPFLLQRGALSGDRSVVGGQSSRQKKSLSGFWSRSSLENRGFFGGFFGAFFLQGKSTKKSTKKPKTKSTSTFREGVSLTKGRRPLGPLRWYCWHDWRLEGVVEIVTLFFESSDKSWLCYALWFPMEKRPMQVGDGSPHFTPEHFWECKKRGHFPTSRMERLRNTTCAEGWGTSRAPQRTSSTAQLSGRKNHRAKIWAHIELKSRSKLA